MQSLQGHLLVASPTLSDSNFARSVTLIVEHNQEGAFGVLVNRPSQATVKELWRDTVGSPCDILAPVFVGGPCEGFLTAVHTDKSLSNIEPLSGIYYTQEPAKLKQLVAQPPGLLRFFAGFSGWGPRQLEAEMQDDSWLTAGASAELVFGEPEDLWTTLVRRILGKDFFARLGINNVPDDPAVN